jgi:hypothetical protein
MLWQAGHTAPCDLQQVDNNDKRVKYSF